MLTFRTRAMIAALLIVVIVIVTGSIPSQGEHYGFWSILPPAVAIILAFVTREVISSLLVGILLGGIITGRINIVQEFLIPSIGTESYAQILLVYLWALGGLIGLWTRTGGAQTFADRAGARMVKGSRSAKAFAWVMGMVFHQGGTISTVLTGTTVRPVTDRHRVSHEELSYIVDSTASPAATLIPFNVWPIYVSGLVIGTVPFITTPAEGIQFFFRALPFNFYGIFAILFTLLFALDAFPRKLPFVVGRKMSNAIRRARETGKLDRDGAEPLAAQELTVVRIAEGYKTGLIDFFGPIGTLLGVAIVPYVYTYYILGSESPAFPIAEAFMLAVLAGVAIALIKGMSLRNVVGAIVDGCKGVTIGAIVLALAVTLKSVADAVGTAAYIIDVTSGFLTPVILPALFLGLCMVIAFSTGTSWGTYAVVFPIAMPLAWSINPDPLFMMLCFGSVLGGSVFGDQCSPISDTTILSSLATGSDLMDHVYTQLPLALTAAAVSAALYTLIAAFAL